MASDYMYVAAGFSFPRQNQPFQPNYAITGITGKGEIYHTCTAPILAPDKLPPPIPVREGPLETLSKSPLLVRYRAAQCTHVEVARQSLPDFRSTLESFVKGPSSFAFQLLIDASS